MCTCRCLSVSCSLIFQERNISVTWSRKTALLQTSSWHASLKDQTIFLAVILSTNYCCGQASFLPSSPSPFLFLSKCLVPPDREEVCGQCIALTSSTFRSLSTEAGLLFTLFLKMPSLKFLCHTRLGDAFSAEVDCCDSPLKLRINVLYR